MSLLPRASLRRSVASFLAVAVAIGGLAPLPSGVAGDAATTAIDRHPDLRRLSPEEDVWVDPVRNEVVVGGAIALDRGMIEVFACPRRTKEHEAIVATDATAKLIHTGLLAIGLEPGKPVTYAPDYVAAAGPVVMVLVRWHDDEGRVVTRSAQELVRDIRTKKPLAADWVFAGSEFWRDPSDGREYYQADGGDMICVSNFPTAMLDLPIESSQANEALMFEVFAERVPPRGTAVELVLSKGK